MASWIFCVCIKYPFIYPHPFISNIHSFKTSVQLFSKFIFNFENNSMENSNTISFFSTSRREIITTTYSSYSTHTHRTHRAFVADGWILCKWIFWYAVTWWYASFTIWHIVGHDRNKFHGVPWFSIQLLHVYGGGFVLLLFYF